MQTVSKIRHTIGTKSEYVLKATLPVPKGTYPRTDGKEPLSVLDPFGNPFPTSVHAVSWYPNKAADGADVVELQIQFKVAGNQTSGQEVILDVVEDPHPFKRLKIDRIARQAIASPMKVVAHDVHGNRYHARISLRHRKKNKARYTKIGRGSLQIETYIDMTPVDPTASNVLEKLLGVKAIFTLWHNEKAISLDLYLHNGHSGLNGNKRPNHNVYFDSLELWVPTGWNVVHKYNETSHGGYRTEKKYEKHTLVKPLSGGKMHVVRQQAHIVRRMVLAPFGEEQDGQFYAEDNTLGFCTHSQGLWSWWTLGGFQSQATHLPWAPHIEPLVKSKNSFWFNDMKDALANGTPINGSPNGVLGWAHPYGPNYGGVTGGTEIDMYPGWLVTQAASLAGYRKHDVYMRANTDRQHQVIINENGEHTKLSDWVIDGPTGRYFPGHFYQTPFNTNGNDIFGFKTANASHDTFVKNNNLLPPYNNALLAYKPYDLQHYIRYTRSLKFLVWMGNDPIAKHLLKGAAEIARLSLKDVPNDENGNAQGFSLYSLRRSATFNPNKANVFGRDHGWCVDTMAAAYSISGNVWRNEALPWFQEVSDVIKMIQGGCNGMLKSHFGSKILNGRYRGQQIFELVIATNALLSVGNQVLDSVDDNRKMDVDNAIVAATDGMMSLACPNFQQAPKHIVATAPLGDFSQPMYCTWNDLPPNGWSGKEATYCFQLLAMAAGLTGNQVYMDKALNIAEGVNTWKPQHQTLLDWLDSLWVNKASGQNLENLAYLYAIAQAVQT
jgi:hypothetical protein